MIVKLDRPKLLSDAIAVISELVNEVKIRLTEEGMSIIAVDPANVAMVLFRLPKETFSQYEAGNDVWGIQLDDLKKILKRASTSSSIVIEQEENQLNISIFDRVKRNFILSLANLNTEDKDEPSLDFAATVEMDSETFAQSIEDCGVVGDSCGFIVGENFFIVESSGSVNSFRAELTNDEVTTIGGIGRAKYSLEYMLKFIKARKLAGKVKIRFADDYPLRLDFAGDKMGIGFILAPRVENN
ncbi:MAG: proliferating cell nuclear antigen [Patescibacteria group bacterium]|jgi:proliferating cell nuclear antigen